MITAYGQFQGPAGPVWVMPAVIERLIDGDTLVVQLHFMPGKILMGEHVRVEGINAPELPTPDGILALKFACTLLQPEMLVMLASRRLEKYGRVLAKVKLPDGRDFGDEMLKAGAAKVMK